MRRDFWPYSQGSLIQISSGHYNYPGAEDDASSTFVHEYVHSMDRTIKLFENGKRKDDGPDVEELHAKIGKLTMENDFLADALGRMGRLSGRK